jgi:putative ABC transport system ATP-binding protein
MAPLISLRGLTRRFVTGAETVTVLDDLNLDIEAGELIAIVGASGSGKSTLMNMLGCLDRPTSGSYRLEGQEIATLSRDGRARVRNQRIGFVFQNFNLLTRTSAVENVELPLLYSKGMTARQRQRRAIELLERVGLGDRLDHHPGQLSGGQQQRVAIARSLVNNPSILMCDEPTGNLDTRTSREVIQLFRDMNEESGITVILVTHDQDVARCARRVIVLRDGEVVEDTEDFARAMKSLHSVDLVEPVDPGSSPDPGKV